MRPESHANPSAYTAHPNSFNFIQLSSARGLLQLVHQGPEIIKQKPLDQSLHSEA